MLTWIAGLLLVVLLVGTTLLRRKPLTPEEQRTKTMETISIDVTPEELSLIRKAAEVEGCSPAVFVRRSANNAASLVAPLEDIMDTDKLQEKLRALPPAQEEPALPEVTALPAAAAASAGSPPTAAGSAPLPVAAPSPPPQEATHPCRFLISKTPPGFLRSEVQGTCTAQPGRPCNWQASNAENCRYYAPAPHVRRV